MKTGFRHYNIRLERTQWDQLAVLAAERNQTPAEIIRAALDVYFGTVSVVSSSQRRLARVSEFVQIAVDVLIREQYPELRDKIVAETDRRLEQYHGA